MKLGALFYPTEDQFGNKIPFESLYIPYIYKEIYFDGIYIDVLNQKKDLVIVDVGANVGVTVAHFQPYAKKLYAIEPSPEHFAALSKNKEFNNWDNVELFNYALADKDGEMTFTLNSHNRTMNTLMLNEGMGVIDKHGYKDQIQVPVKSIDHFFEENKITHVDFMKFDPEGAEDLILRSAGFRKIAHMIDTLEVEFHFPNWKELVQYLMNLGFKAREYETSAKVILFFR